jgi:hypothetical protein
MRRTPLSRKNPSEADYEAIERAVSRAAGRSRRNPDGGGDVDEAFAALDHSDKVREKLYAHRDQIGTRRGVRLDIPSAKRGIVVVSVHEGPSGGTVIGYDRSAVVDDARFVVQAGGQRQIGAEGSNKFPMSYVGGTLAGVDAEPAGVPVYYDPRHVHLYVDARNGLPLKGAGRVNFIAQRGGDYFIPEIRTIYIWAEDPIYYAPGEVPEAPEGMESAVVMPKTRANPEPTPSIRFVYGARRLARGGFAPVVAQHGPGRSAHEHGGWVAQGYDEDVALAIAKEHAEELASQYIGDWNIEIVPEGGRANPDSLEDERQKQADKEWLENALIEIIRAMYENWKRRGGKEPALTTSLLRDIVIEGTGGVPDNLKWATPRKQNLAVLNALEKLKRRGVVESSLGIGQRGTETKLWNLR